MKIIVCIKQVPNTTEIKIDPVTNTLKRDGVPSIINPDDKAAIEAALQLKESCGATVTVLTMGPPQAEKALREALAMGADEAFLLTDRAFGGSDTLATSTIIAAAIQKLGCDLVLCGRQAIDGDTAQTGPGIANQLNIPQITFCSHVDANGNQVVVKKLIDGGKQVLEADMPVLVTMTMPVDYAPKYPSFMAAHKAQEKPVHTWTAADIGADPSKLGLNGSPTRVDRIFPPPARPKGEMFAGSPAELASKLVEILKKESFVK